MVSSVSSENSEVAWDERSQESRRYHAGGCLDTKIRDSIDVGTGDTEFAHVENLGKTDFSQTAPSSVGVIANNSNLGREEDRILEGRPRWHTTSVHESR